DRKPAVRDLGRLLDALRPDRRDVDRDLAAVEDRAEGLTEPGRVRARVRDLVVLAPVDDWLVAGPDLAHDRHVLARLHDGRPEPLPVPALDDLRPRDPEPEEEAAARELVQGRRGRRGHRRRARRHLHDRRAEMDLRRLSADPGERGDGVRAVRLGRPDRVEGEPLGLVDEAHVDGQPGPRVADVEAEPHDAAAQLPWKPYGTRWGRTTRATGSP